MVSFSCGDITKATRQTFISPYYLFFPWVGIMQDTEGKLTLSKTGLKKVEEQVFNQIIQRVCNSASYTKLLIRILRPLTTTEKEKNKQTEIKRTIHFILGS